MLDGTKSIMPDGTNFYSWGRYPEWWHGFDNMWERWPEIARKWWGIEWDRINPEDLVAIVAWLAQRAMEISLDADQRDEPALWGIDRSLIWWGIR